MKSLSLLAVLVIFLASLAALPGSANALVAAEVAGLPIMAGIGLLQIFILFFLFLFIPIAFIGMILRLLGFKKEGEGEGWRWNLKQALFRFVKYLLYHAGLFGLWFIFLKIAVGDYFIYASRYDYRGDLFELSPSLIGGHLFLFLIYAIAWAFIGPYVIYFWHQLNKTPTFKPSLGSHIRLALWNVFLFFVARVILQIIISRF